MPHELHDGGGRLVLLVQLDAQRAQAGRLRLELPAMGTEPPCRPAVGVRRAARGELDRWACTRAMSCWVRGSGAPHGSRVAKRQRVEVLVDPGPRA